MYLRKILLGLVFLLFCLGLTGCGTQTFSAVDTGMGTTIVQTIYGSVDVTDEVLSLFTTLETETLSRRVEGSEVYQLNASGEWECSSFLTEILETVLLLSEDSGGALDVTIGELVCLWDIDSYASGEKEDFTLPTPEEVAEALSHSGYENLTLVDGKAVLTGDISIDLGAVGKGAACDAAADFLAKTDTVSGAVISVGGSILTYGSKPDGSDWVIAIVDPSDTSSYIATLTLPGGMFVSTSGDYERYVEVEGVRYHHILDPATGYPAESGLCSVTIVSESGVLSDALSTACFVLGEEEGLALVTRWGAEAFLVRTDGTVAMTPGMEDRITLRDP